MAHENRQIPGDLKRNNGFVAAQHGFVLPWVDCNPATVVGNGALSIAARMKLQKPWGNVAAIFSLRWTENA